MMRRDVVAVLSTAAVGTAMVAFAHAAVAMRAVWLPGAFVLCLVGAIGWRAMAAVRRRTPPPPRPEGGVADTWPYSGAFHRIGHLSGMLDFVPSDARHFEYGVRPLLTDLVDDRLRRYHGVDRHDRPEAARQILGEELWTLVTTTQRTSPSATQVRDWVETIERIGRT